MAITREQLEELAVAARKARDAYHKADAAYREARKAWLKQSEDADAQREANFPFSGSF